MIINPPIFCNTSDFSNILSEFFEKTINFVQNSLNRQKKRLRKGIAFFRISEIPAVSVLCQKYPYR